MPSNDLVLCRPLLLPPSIFPSIRVFSNESASCGPKYWSFSFGISLFNEDSGLISFRMDWLDLPVVQGTLKSLVEHHRSSTTSIDTLKVTALPGLCWMALVDRKLRALCVSFPPSSRFRRTDSLSKWEECFCSWRSSSLVRAGAGGSAHAEPRVPENTSGCTVSQEPDAAGNDRGQKTSQAGALKASGAGRRFPKRPWPIRVSVCSFLCPRAQCSSVLSGTCDLCLPCAAEKPMPDRTPRAKAFCKSGVPEASKTLSEPRTGC